MAHPNAERYLELINKFQGEDMSELGDLLAPDVVWHEAGNPDALRGRDAVVARMTGMGTGTAPSVDVRTVLADDDNIVCVGHAKFEREGQGVSYDYVEHMAMKDGLVTERWSYMDAVPGDVEAFFAG
jgi:ketosteroid isomerase-like protein